MHTSTAVRATAALLLGVAPIVAIGGAAAAGNPAPRITSAALADADGDDRADRVVLTYSEPVNHALDKDGTYPFRVKGYHVKRVLAATKSPTLVILLREHTEPDIAATPNVVYARTTKGKVTDRSGKQAVSQTFDATTPLDTDGDGWAAADCATDDAGVNPGAADAPDLTFLDANCDGIDGQRTGPIFVSPTGTAEGAGTIEDPLLSLDAALGVVSEQDIYLATANEGYTWGLTAPVTHSIFSGYEPASWTRDATPVGVTGTGAPRLTGDRTLELVDLTVPGTTTPGLGTVALSASDGTLTLAQSTVTAGNGGAANGDHPAYSSIAVQLENATLSMTGGALSAGGAGNGLAGPDGADGAAGSVGSSGLPGSCDGSGFGAGGAGGSSPAGHGGGAGGRGGFEGVNAGLQGSTSADGTLGGPGGAGGNPGSPGTVGGTGGNGAGGASGTVAQDVFGPAYAPGVSSAGTNGAFGHGGGGGGGGGGQGGTFVDDGSGNGGGGGGAGGAGGAAGGGATGGGGSFAVYAVDSLVTLDGVEVTTGNGGNGGAGGTGGGGGNGGTGGAGAAQCTGEVGRGGNGGPGGNGGDGGDGGDGAGGASVGIVLVGSSAADVVGTAFQIGAGGTSPAGGDFDGESTEIKSVG